MNTVYNLNGLIEVEIDGPASYVSYFDNEYQRICLANSVDEAPKPVPRVRLMIVDDTTALPARRIRFKNLFEFVYAISNLESNRPTIYFQRHWLDRTYVTALGAFIQGQLLEPLMYLKLLENEVLFMHAAGVAQDGKAFVFPAHGGTGKTTLSLGLLERAFELMGDDLLMVDARTGTVHPFARPLHLFTYNLKSLDVPLRVLLAIKAKDVLRSILQVVTGQKFLISTRVHVDEIMDIRFASSASLEKVTFLKSVGVNETLALDDAASFEKAVKMIVESADLNQSLFENIAENDSIKSLELKVIRKVLRHVGQMDVINARQTDRTAVAQGLEHDKSFRSAAT